MNNENKSSNLKEPNVRITRARAKALGPSGDLPLLYPLAAKKVIRITSKRTASGDKKPTKIDVLNDVTNVTRINTKRDEHRKREKEGSSNLRKKGKVSHSCLVKESRVPGDKFGNISIDSKKVNEDGLIETSSAKSLKIEPTGFDSQAMSATAENEKLCKNDESSDDRGVTDIDSKHEDPQMCSMYAADIYYNLYTTELARRPLFDYMEKVQQDINQDMRAILVDWLVEVSDEYKMVLDTLYLTVNLIDRFLSDNYIEKQKLQLLGVSCMLIASKYEEICAPRVEEFCFITDHTYTKEEVTKMESRVLNFLGFQLFVPTTKKFIRRFIQAAQVSYEAPSIELEFLANYLSELTLMEYSFLKFLPSVIAASAVFLARWTIDQSQHPWNPTLECYTRYKTIQLKGTVLELQELQLNTRGCVHKAIREKYKQSKFKCVSTLRPSKPVQSLF